MVCVIEFSFLFSDALCTTCKVTSVIFDITFWLGYCNSMLNPVIYAVWNKEFRKTFGQILTCRCTQKKNKTISQPVTNNRLTLKDMRKHTIKEYLTCVT